MFGLVNELGNPFPAIPAAPNQLSILPRCKILAAPICFEAVDNLRYFVRLRSNDGVVAGFGQVLALPIQRFHKCGGIVDDHRFFVGKVEGGVAVQHVDAGGQQCAAAFIVLRNPIAAFGIQHDPHGHTPAMRFHHGGNQRRIGKDEHLDAKGFRRMIDCVQNRLRRIIW